MYKANADNPFLENYHLKSMLHSFPLHRSSPSFKVAGSFLFSDIRYVCYRSVYNYLINIHMFHH